jgi:hypothetical protein
MVYINNKINRMCVIAFIFSVLGGCSSQEGKTSYPSLYSIPKQAQDLHEKPEDQISKKALEGTHHSMMKEQNTLIAQQAKEGLGKK